MQKINKVGSTQKLVLCAVLTALIVLLQFLGASIHFGPFSLTLVLVPIVIGAAMCGTMAGVWLGLVFGAVVLMTDAGAFLAVSVPGTVITVLAKGALCGLCAGLIYQGLSKCNRYLAVVAAALVCPVVNTGVFLLGCSVFFMDALSGWAAAAGLYDSVFKYMIFGMVGVNFLLETGINMVLSPVIVRLLRIGQKS